MHNVDMGSINDKKIKDIEKLYYQKKLSMQKIANILNVTPKAVIYFMKKHNLKRRSFPEISALRFKMSTPSFKVRKNLGNKKKELKIAGAILYWAEGYKTEKSSGIDFTNSDPEMIKVFMNFLRNIYELDESRFRILLYCYSDQNVEKLIKFWSKITHIPIGQFTKPYIRNDFNKSGRRMEYGMVHIRYMDKKLLLSVKNLIDLYVKKLG